MPVYFNVSAAEPIPKATPQAFEIGMLAGEKRAQTITLENPGFAVWSNVTLTQPVLDWVKLQGLSELGDMPPGGFAAFTLSFEPPDGLTPGDYIRNPLLEVKSSNGDTIPINVGVSVASARRGVVTFSVVNADVPIGDPEEFIPGARVTLTSWDVGGLSFMQTTGVNGGAVFENVPSGRYAWKATA